MYEERFYRYYVKASNLQRYTIIEQESDLQIFSQKDVSQLARLYLLEYRNDIEEYVKKHKEFFHTLTPVEVWEDAPRIVTHMAKAARTVNVGPMAAVAGGISEYVGHKLLQHIDEVIIENGGDIFIKTNSTRKIMIYAGNSPFSNKLALEVLPENTPVGICTSAGTVGHSLSFGKADAVVVVSKDTLLADAAATAIGNIVETYEDIEKGISFAQNVKQIEGILIIVGDKMGAWGQIKIIEP